MGSKEVLSQHVYSESNSSVFPSSLDTPEQETGSDVWDMVHHTTSEKTRLRLYRDYKICDSSFFSEGSASECFKKLKLFDQFLQKETS